MTHIKIGNAPKKSLPFYKDKKGRVGFNPRPGVNIDYGVSFDLSRGHRVFFNYCDTPHFKNTWGTKSLRSWARNLDTSNPELRQWQTVLFQQCALAEQMDKDWHAAGCPIEGVPEPDQPIQ